MTAKVKNSNFARKVQSSRLNHKFVTVEIWIFQLLILYKPMGLFIIELK